MGSTSNKGAKSETKMPLIIYTCGNAEEIKKFNVKEVRGDNYMEQDSDYSEEKHPKFDWYFNYYLTEMNEDLVTKIMNKISSGYKNKNNSNNNIMLIFFDSKETIDEKKEKIRIIFEKLDKIYKIYKPIIILAFKENKSKINTEGNSEERELREESLIEAVIEENKYDNYLSRKYIEIIHYKENDYFEISKKINSINCYYNNIGDIFSILDEMIKSFKSKTRNKTKYNATFNILFLGRPGSGKSTLINLLLNKRKAREGIGDSITKVVSKYVHDKYPITFEDTPGFENDEDLQKMIKFLEDYNEIFKGGKNQFHLVLYLINSSNARTFMGQEIELINFIKKTMKIPIFFVCTRSKNKDYAKNFEEVVRVNLWQNFGENTHLIDHIYCCHLLNEKDGIYKQFGIDELLEGIKNYFNKEIERKEKELAMNQKEEKDNINSENEENIDKISDDCLFLSGLKSSKDFEDYLNKISFKIIKNYENLTYLEEKEANKNNNNNKINELLVDHLAMELNGQSPGNIFCKKNLDKIIDNVENYKTGVTLICRWPKSPDENVKGGITIKDENLKTTIRKTREFGMEAKTQFLNELRNEYGFEEYLKSIIENYKQAIKSLTNLNKIEIQ